MNIKDFLVDNYIYIIIVILLIIVTIIGFLADKKKNGGGMSKSNQKMSNGSENQAAAQPIIMSQPINYQPLNNPIPNNNINLMPQNNNLNFNQIPNLSVVPNNNVTPIQNEPVIKMGEQLQNVNRAVNTIPVNNNIVGANSFEQPQPSVVNPVRNQMAPSPINQVNSVPDNGLNIPNTPQPIEPMNQNVNIVPEPLYQPLSEQKPTFAPSQAPVIAVPNTIVNNVNPTHVNPVPLNNYNMDNNPNIPIQGINQAPVSGTMNNVGTTFNNQEPVSPVPIPNPSENATPNPITPPGPVTPQPVNFVFGPQQQNGTNNNPYMQ